MDPKHMLYRQLVALESILFSYNQLKVEVGSRIYNARQELQEQVDQLKTNFTEEELVKEKLRYDS